MKVFVPYPAVSEANRTGEHWAKKKRRHDAQKQHTWLALRSDPSFNEITPTAWRVHFEVHCVRRMDDDNAAGACKFYRDEVARFLGVDDGDVERVRFTVSQKIVPRRHVGVEISIEPWEDEHDKRQVPA